MPEAELASVTPVHAVTPPRKVPKPKNAAMVPFKGSFQGQENDQPVPRVGRPQQLLVDGTVTGVATHFGQFTMHHNVVVSNPTKPVATATGSAELTAANGDMIFTAIIGRA
jgi:hypothetical protein